MDPDCDPSPPSPDAPPPRSSPAGSPRASLATPLSPPAVHAGPHSRGRTPSRRGAVPSPIPVPAAPAPCQVSVIVPSPDPRPSQDGDPELELECAVCFSQFDNVFRCPKMLHCKHTFCLECLARINVKSADPGAVQCPLCRGLTPLPALGLPRLATDAHVLSCLPAAMQRAYSIRFLRSKGKLQVKRSSDGQQQWGQRSLPGNRSLDVGLPSPRGTPGGEAGGVGGALFRLTGRPACRAFLLTAVVMMMVLLTGIIVFLLAFNRGDN